LVGLGRIFERPARRGTCHPPSQTDSND
jgi:hypothetical protein